jgi:GH15 family glucan-1,4-alpha-glucosidase
LTGNQSASDYQPIESYGLIGDLHTVALVGMDGSIDWCCLPHFNSPAVFAAILDAKKGGRFKIAPDGATRHKQMYFPDTNVLLTRFVSPGGVGEVVDFMPVRPEGANGGDHTHEIVRRVRVVRGSLGFRVECFPAFDFGRAPHRLTIETGGAVFASDGMVLGLVASVPLHGQAGGRGDADMGAVGNFTLREGESASFVLRQVESGSERSLLSTPENFDDQFARTTKYWRDWLARSRYTGRWREMVNRSALTLKLLTYEPSGAIVAAPTASLPERIGGARNWDYRYTWIRDASFTLYALLRLGFTREAERFMGWLEQRLVEIGPDGTLQIVYGIDGKHKLTEEELSHLEGYRGSRPVRIGNAAYGQRQLDIQGELMDSVYLYDKSATPISYDLWTSLRRLVDWTCEHWREPDEGIWEVRGGQQQFVYSKLMCWVAIDRGLRLADKRSFPADRQRWLTERDTIFEEIMSKGWSETRGAFVQSYGSEALDASNLLMPLVKFISPTDPRMLATIDRTIESLMSDSLVYRYRQERAAADGFGTEEGTFSMCTFWLVEALARARRVNEARVLFEKMLSYANDLGLYSEELGPQGESLGNFPQAFTHVGLISAAYALDRALGAGHT